MKIRVEFEHDEDVLFNEVFDSTQKISDVSQKVEGKFGYMQLNNNVFEAKLSTKFIKNYAKLIFSIVNTIKSMMITFEMFINQWFDDEDIKIIELDEEKDKTEFTDCENNPDSIKKFEEVE